MFPIAVTDKAAITTFTRCDSGLTTNKQPEGLLAPRPGTTGISPGRCSHWKVGKPVSHVSASPLLYQFPVAAQMITHDQTERPKRTTPSSHISESSGQECAQVALGCDPGVGRLPSFWGFLKGPFPPSSGVGRIQFLTAAGLSSLFSWWLSPESHPQLLEGTAFPSSPPPPSSKSASHLICDPPEKGLHF